MAKERNQCPECHGVVSPGYPDCTAVFEAVCALEYGDPLGFGAVHLLTVDAYALQHSQKRSARSNAFHLLRLCQLIEHGQNPGLGGRPARVKGKAFEEIYRGFPYLQPPVNPGKLTIFDLYGASDATEHAPPSGALRPGSLGRLGRASPVGSRAGEPTQLKADHREDAKSRRKKED